MTDDQSELSGNITSSALLVEVGLAVAALVGGYLVGFSPLESVSLTVDSLAENGPAVVWGLVATLPMLVMLLVIQRIPFGPLVNLNETVEELLLPLFAKTTVFELALIALAAGVGEEMLFRGLLQTALAEWFDGSYGVWIALGLASVVFGVCHWITPTYAVLATLISIYLGGLFLWTENLTAPIVTHSLYDFIALVYLVKWKRQPSVESECAQKSGPIDDDRTAS